MADLSSLRAVTSTGMVLSEQLFHWFYTTGFPPHAQLANISGGTDIAGCFAMENPLTPVYVGGCQGPSLGTAVAVYDQTHEGGAGVRGTPVPAGVPGELVAPLSFPNMPVRFWGADGARRYFDAYFARFDNVWTHGDFVQLHPATGQVVFLGRADGVLNPSGVRFGSAEIYNVIEKQFASLVQDSIVVGQRRPTDDDESVMLFLKMQPGVKFEPALVARIHDAIARECSKRHVPKYTFETPEIPVSLRGLAGCRSCICVAPRLTGTPYPHIDDRQPEKGRAPRQAHCQRAHRQAVGHAAEPGVAAVLLPLRKGRGRGAQVGRQAEQALVDWQIVKMIHDVANARYRTPRAPSPKSANPSLPPIIPVPKQIPLFKPHTNAVAHDPPATPTCKSPPSKPPPLKEPT